MLSIIIVASGSSRRMGFDKLMADLHGKPVLQHTVEAFAQVKAVSEIIIVTNDDRFQQLQLESLTKAVKQVEGGADRHHSVANGLAEVSPQSAFIAVHDGARPLISPAQIMTVLNAAQQHDAAASARQVTETVKRADSENKVTESICRDHLWLMETPQIFKADILQQAYQAVTKHNLLVTDEVSALEHIGIATYLVQNPSPNPKITFPHDLEL